MALVENLAQIVGHLGPNIDSGAPNDTFTITDTFTPDATIVIFSGAAAASSIVAGAKYHIMLVGATHCSNYVTMEWGEVGTPAPGNTDFAWPFGVDPHFYFEGKAGQKKLSFKYREPTAGSGGAVWAGFSPTPRFVVRKLSL